jgi:hypothetical protein
MSPDLKRYVKLGAALRLQQLDTERQAILTAFPDLARGTQAPANGPRKRRKMSAAARAKIAEAATRRWAEWRKKKQG